MEQFTTNKKKILQDPVGARVKHAQMQADIPTRQQFPVTFQDGPFQPDPSLTSLVICQVQNSESLTNNMTSQQNMDSVFLNCNSESLKQERIEMWPENIVKCVVGDAVKDIDMNNPHETSLESTDDWTSSDTDEEVETFSKPSGVSPNDPEQESTDDSTSSDTDDEVEMWPQPVTVSPNDPEQESTDYSTSSSSGDEDGTSSEPVDTSDYPEYALESGSSSDSGSSDRSSDSSDDPDSKATPKTLNTICFSCGRGPYKRLRMHRVHCLGERQKYICTLCNTSFQSVLSLKHHLVSLFSCDICNQVFFHEQEYTDHQCPKGGNSPFLFFCCYSKPKQCQKCKLFFTCKKTLLNHDTAVHKFGTITNQSNNLTYKKVPIGVQSRISSTGNVEVYNGATCQNPNPAGQICAGSMSTSTSNPPVQLCKISPSSPVTSGESHLLFFPPEDTDKPPPTPPPSPVSPPAVTIMALFENNSRNLALMKRMSAGWRSKAPRPCRECGAILRQPSHIISHRYLHRGRRPHRCQCGRAFVRRMHLLRHCVQHAEAMSFICASCGETFTGARQLAEHMNGKSRKKYSSSSAKCKMPFTCDCGQPFFRPSAYIWHQLSNKTKTKQ